MLRRHGVISGICVVISFRETQYGALCVFETKPCEFSKDVTQFLQAVSNVLAAAAQRKRADDEIRILATTDSLTGIANRREFTSILEREFARARRYTTPLSLVMYDLDRFKQVNDSYGHDAGDLVLQTVSNLVRQNIRSIDVEARWGGEEFMILMPQSDLPAAKSAAEKLRLAIAKHRFEKIDHLSVSFGVTAFAPQDDINSLLKRVDDALYTAKGAGRNCVESLVREAGMADRAAGAP
jgi:diguanylate cyclase (GGDEF)-like protein